MGRAVSQVAEDAVVRAVEGLEGSQACFVLAFVPAHLDIDETVAALGRHLRGIPVYGCTTAGQITTQGYESDALLLLAFPKEHFRCASLLFSDLAPISAPAIGAAAQKLAEKFRHTVGWNRLALIFADGLCKQEDLLASTLETALDGLPTFGGSAGDGFRFERTFVLHGGRAHTDAAVLILLETDLEFQGLGFDHFLPVGRQVVITGADPEERRVYEINGAPAALEYARLVGCSVDQLSPEIFAENPMLLRHNRKYYIRAVRNVSENHAISFLAAIDDGLILTLGRGQAIIETLESELDLANDNGNPPDFILGFDCALRKLEIEQKQLHEPVSGILRKRRVFGFNTYGEQNSGVHINQTFVGVAFFEPQPRALNL
ncbi:FIST signal transduction protein [Rhodovulum imhoffii]|nr:FIST signal transduction protein [Rhodovulum imhoffii]